MNEMYENRAKSVWETRISQIPGLPSWRKNSFKDGATKQESFKSARNQKLKFFIYSKTCCYPYFLQTKSFSDAPYQKYEFFVFFSYTREPTVWLKKACKLKYF